MDRDLSRAAPVGNAEDAPFDAFARFRRRFTGPLIANLGFDRDSGNAVIEAGIADAVSFAARFIANPDLVARFALGRDLGTGDPATYYIGGAGGYVDYPVSDWQDDGRQPRARNALTRTAEGAGHGPVSRRADHCG